MDRGVEGVVGCGFVGFWVVGGCFVVLGVEWGVVFMGFGGLVVEGFVCDVGG